MIPQRYQKGGVAFEPTGWLSYDPRTGKESRYQKGGVAEEAEESPRMREQAARRGQERLNEFLYQSTQPSEIPVIVPPMRERTYYRNPYQGPDIYSPPESYYPVEQFEPEGMYIPQGQADLIAQQGGVAPATPRRQRLMYNQALRALRPVRGYAGGGTLKLDGAGELGESFGSYGSGLDFTSLTGLRSEWDYPEIPYEYPAGQPSGYSFGTAEAPSFAARSAPFSGAPASFAEPTTAMPSATPSGTPFGGQQPWHADLGAARQKFSGELRDPSVRNRLFSLAKREGGHPQAFLESVFNRAAARNRSLRHTISNPAYYPKKSLKQVSVTPQEQAELQSHLAKVQGGSNVSNFATGNASGNVHFGGGPTTFEGGGDRYGIEKRDLTPELQRLTAGRPGGGTPMGPMAMPRFQEGGISDDDSDTDQETDEQEIDANDNPASWQPSRAGTTGLEATAPDNAFQAGGTVLTPRQRQLMYQRLMTTMRPPLQTARPIYTAPMLMSPPRNLSGYAGELATPYQEGGVTNEDQKKGRQDVIVPERGAGGAEYWYVDPRATAGYAVERAAAFGPADLEEARAVAAQSQPPPGYRWHYDLDTGQTVLVPGEAGAYKPTEFNPYTTENIQFQEGGVVYPDTQATPDQAGLLQALLGQQGQRAPRQQPSPIAGEPARKAPPTQQGKYEFGPSDYFYVVPDRSATEKAKGGVPKSFMRYLARGGVVRKFTPEENFMFELGQKYAVPPNKAKKGLTDKISRSNPLPP
jgi:hypothetical protein